MSADVTPDGPGARLVKYIPAEILAIFTAFIGAAAAVTMSPETAQEVAAGALVAFTLATYGYIWKRAPLGPVRSAHLLVSPVAFLAWGYAVSSAMLGSWFFGLVSLGAQALVALLAVIIVPTEA